MQKRLADLEAILKIPRWKRKNKDVLSQEDPDVLKAKVRIAEETIERNQAVYSSLKPLDFLRFPMQQNRTAPAKTLRKWLETIENRLRNGENLYLFSKHGHGRPGVLAACLIGRLYGLSSTDAIRHIQRCHDVVSTVISTPQSMSQIQSVHQILSQETETVYLPVMNQEHEGRLYQRGLAIADHGRRETINTGHEHKKRQYRTKRELNALKLRQRRQREQREFLDMTHQDRNTNLP